jgi:hypothetical protein
MVLLKSVGSKIWAAMESFAEFRKQYAETIAKHKTYYL